MYYRVPISLIFSDNTLYVPQRYLPVTVPPESSYR